MPIWLLLFNTLLFRLTTIDKSGNNWNQSRGGENNAYDIKAQGSKIETTTDSDRADEETENQTQGRLHNSCRDEFIFNLNPMGCLIFSLDDEPLR